MDRLISSVLGHFGDRMKRLGLFEPLYSLTNKRGRDQAGKPIDYFSLGLLTLLFFFEGMLLRKKNTGVKELARFLNRLNQGEMTLVLKDYDKIAQEIIHVFRPPGGKRNHKTFYNWETRQEETVYYSFLKTPPFDGKTNSQYYLLDEDGLELVFASKEYFSEFQLSINQLVLRKQLEKGEFVSALRQIDEMRMDVEQITNRIVRVKHEILRNIISDETFQRYRHMVEDINLRLARENEEFEELQSFVQETKERLGYQRQGEKERKTYQLILQIDQELGEVHYAHRQLLQKSIILKTTALDAAQESLYYVGVSSFNFQDQITGKLFSTPLPLHTARFLSEPFLHLEQVRLWSPLAVFGKQRLEKKGEEGPETAFPDHLTEEEIEATIQIQQENFKQITELILKFLGEASSITLHDIVTRIQSQDQGQEVLAHRSFYDYWILLHQFSPLDLDKKEHPPVLAGAIKLLATKAQRINVVELSEVIKPGPRYSINNMDFRLEDEY